jgi:uncharacterized RDD family membrane protein YckC
MSNLLDDSPKFNNNDRHQFNNTEIHRADFSTRLGAYLLDFLFMIIFISVLVFFIAVISINAINESASANGRDPVFDGILASFLSIIWSIIIGAALYALLEAFTGASLGKMVVGIKIGTQDAKTAPVGRYLVRALIKNFQFVLLILTAYTYDSVFLRLNDIYSVFFIVSCLVALGADRLALHDKMTGTAVYKKRDLDR